MFSNTQIGKLREEFATINTIDPCAPTYRKLIKMLDAMTQTQLRQIRDANIKFLSKLAINRIMEN